MTQQLNSLEVLQLFIDTHPIAAIYFSAPDCGVCAVLKPKLMAMLEQRFPALARAEVDCSRHPAVSAQQGVFVVPTLIVYMDGREGLRKSRAFSPASLEQALARPHSMLSDG